MKKDLQRMLNIFQMELNDINAELVEIRGLLHAIKTQKSEE